ncbi:MAG: hypothetical protein SFX73_19265 [Kofleriaceae bacterium]|nr:hypothetical protein [Kofleriaceae bacterium]
MRDHVGEVLAAACVDRAVLARLGGPLGDAARSAACELAALEESARRMKRATWAATARAPMPAGLWGIDASWIEAALDGLPARAREALAAGATDPASVWLVRRACAAFPPLPAIEPALVLPTTPDDVARLAPAALRSWLENAGADLLAFALGSHASEVSAAVGPRLARALDRIGRAPRMGQLGDRRAMIERAKVPLDERVFVRLGARAVAPHLAALDRVRVGLRFPRPLGLVISEELRAFAMADRGPAWSALCAGVGQ